VTNNVLFLFEDALRYDAYYSDEMKPLRDFLGPVTRFPRWYSVSNCSDPNTASMMTGMYPWEHGVRHMGDSLGPHHTIFDAFRDRGFLTLFSGWGRYKVIRGMDWHQSLWSPGHIADVRHRVTPNLLAMLCCVPPDRPWFAFARHMWCHARYVNKHYADPVAKTAEDLIRLIFQVRRTWPNTTVIITADHGEFFDGPGGKHRGVLDAPATPPQHAWGLFEPQVHVPMIVSYPNGKEAVHLSYFQHTDLMRLALDLPTQQRDLVLMESTGVDAKYSSYYHRGVISENAKLILGGKDGAQDPLLYTRNVEGFDETHNQAQAFPKLVAELTEKLPPLLTYTSEEEQVVLERLVALGYGE